MHISQVRVVFLIKHRPLELVASNGFQNLLTIR